MEWQDNYQRRGSTKKEEEARLEGEKQKELIVGEEKAEKQEREERIRMEVTALMRFHLLISWV